MKRKINILEDKLEAPPRRYCDDAGDDIDKCVMTYMRISHFMSIKTLTCCQRYRLIDK